MSQSGAHMTNTPFCWIMYYVVCGLTLATIVLAVTLILFMCYDAYADCFPPPRECRTNNHLAQKRE